LTGLVTITYIFVLKDFRFRFEEGFIFVFNQFRFSFYSVQDKIISVSVQFPFAKSFPFKFSLKKIIFVLIQFTLTKISLTMAIGTNVVVLVYHL